jgi:hypothetical protein
MTAFLTTLAGETVIRTSGEPQDRTSVLYIHYETSGSFAVTTGPRPGMKGETKMEIVKAPKGADENEAKEWLVKTIGGARLKLVEKTAMALDGTETKEKRLLLPNQSDLAEKMEEWLRQKRLIKGGAAQ